MPPTKRLCTDIRKKNEKFILKTHFLLHKLHQTKRCKLHNLIITNTIFKQQVSHQAAWT